MMNDHPLYEMALNNLYDADSMTWKNLDHHTWSCKSQFEFLLIGLTIQSFIQQTQEDALNLKDGKTEAFEIAPDRTVPVLCECITSFVYKGRISEGPEPVSVVATTNDIELLDKAIRNRPGRFNRKWAFELPEAPQVESLLEVYFGKDTLTETQVQEIANHRLTGDLVRELHRTARVAAQEKGCSIAECVDEALEILNCHFQLEGSHVGFLT